MKRLMGLVAGLAFLNMIGCVQKPPAAIKIGNVEISAKEFDKAFKMSRYYSKDPKARKMFLDVFIIRQLMLKEAREMGLDRDPVLMQNVHLFWEQSLLKLVLARHMNEEAMRVRLTRKEIVDYYQQHKDREFAQAKDVGEVYDQIRRVLLAEKKRQATQGWVETLMKKTSVVVEKKQLGL